MPRFMRVLIHLPYGVTIRDYLVSYYSALNIVCNRSFCRRSNACKSGAKDDHVSSLNCDRRFHFLKQRAIQLLFAPENLSCFLLTARKGAPETRFKCEPLSYKRRDAQT